jgi:hypothetical protein
MIESGPIDDRSMIDLTSLMTNHLPLALAKNYSRSELLVGAIGCFLTTKIV